MTRILCAVRGGPDSEQTIEYAVSLTEKQKGRLSRVTALSSPVSKSKRVIKRHILLANPL
jgi:hypothetical protein